MSTSVVANLAVVCVLLSVVCVLLSGATAFSAAPPVSAISGSLSPPTAASQRWPCLRPAPGRLRGGSENQGSDAHPAVQGWPDKYTGKVGGATGPRALHAEFAVETASQVTLAELDVNNWPTWTTAGNAKWVVGKTNADKQMPYGELSYVISGKIEIVPPSGDPVVVQAGDFVTFPEGFISTWTVVEELTWRYFLY